MTRPLVAGNWKMNGSRADAQALIAAIRADMQGLDAVDVAVCPSFVLLPVAAQALASSTIALGAQNVCDEDEGAYTGEVSGAMLRECGCRYVIVGHSERRSLYGESDELVARRFMAAKRHGLVPILCVGETLEQRDRGETETVVERQLAAVASAAGSDAFEAAVIAYEPVWAIGTGKTATPEQAQQVHAFIRDYVSRRGGEGVRILYGGSMKPANAADLLAMKDIDGGLIGGASLDADSFLAICRAAAQGA